MTVWLGGGQGTKTQTEELLLRFKTSRPAGLLLTTSAETNSPDRLEIALVAGRIRASVRLSDREKVSPVLLSDCQTADTAENMKRRRKKKREEERKENKKQEEKERMKAPDNEEG